MEAMPEKVFIELKKSRDVENQNHTKRGKQRERERGKQRKREKDQRERGRKSCSSLSSLKVPFVA